MTSTAPTFSMKTSTKISIFVTIVVSLIIVAGIMYVMMRNSDDDLGPGPGLWGPGPGEEEDELEGKGPGPLAPASGPILPTARYIKLAFHEGTPDKYVLTPREIKVIDAAGTNMALSGTISGVSGHESETTYPRGAIIDGSDTTMWHSKLDADTDFITIDLGADKVIAKIEILNNTATTVYNEVAANARMSGGGPTSTDKGAYVELKNATGSVVKITPDIKTIADMYTINFNDTTPTWN